MGVDGGRPAVDAGPTRVVDGGTVGPFKRGFVTLSQTVREEPTRTTVSATLSATFLEVAAGTPSPCAEVVMGACVVRTCNVGGSLAASTTSAGSIRFDGLLPPLQPADAGADAGVDAGSLDAGFEWVLLPDDAGVASRSVAQRVFFGGAPVTVSASGDVVPAFTSPELLTPAQVSLSSPRCVQACAPVSRAEPLRVAWSGVSGVDVLVRLSTAQVTVTCTADAVRGSLEVPVEALAELPPSAAVGEATLTVLARAATRFDAGAWDVTVAAETPTLLPVSLLP
jgi:hypothetical protein